MSLEKMLELNTAATELNTAAVSRLADLMERFKPNAATSEAVTPKAEKPAPKKKAPAKKVTLVDPPDQRDETTETPKAEPVEVKAEPVEVKEEPKAEPVEVKEEPKAKEVSLVDIQKVARVLITAGGDDKTQAKAAIETVAGKGAKIASLDKALYADVLAALEAVQANLEEV